MPSLTHEYHAELTWTGSTKDGLAGYDRTHRVRVPPADVELVLSSDPAFRGSPGLLNPEQLLTAAVSSCQMLTFLSLAARARLDVLSYRDSAVARMPTRLSRIDAVVLHPTITVRGPAEPAEVVALVERAHRECFIARSVNAEIAIEPHIDVVEASVTL
jgi:organic hydroperoxide reductase OsmC/OhrA